MALPASFHDRGTGLQRRVAPEVPDLDLVARDKAEALAAKRFCKVTAAGVQGSGFLVGPDLVLTCCHVIEHGGARAAPEEISALFAEFEGPDVSGWTSVGIVQILAASPPTQMESDGAFQPGVSHVPGMRGFLDFAVLRIAADIGRQPAGYVSQRGWYHLPGAGSAEGQAFLMACHSPAAGLLLSLSEGGTARVTNEGCRVAYRLNTRPGVSGAAVLSLQGLPVAIHNYAPREPMYHDGREIWVNQGVPLKVICAVLQENHPALWAAIAGVHPGPPGWISGAPSFEAGAAYVMKVVHDHLHAAHGLYARTVLRHGGLDHGLTEAALDAGRRLAAEWDLVEAFTGRRRLPAPWAIEPCLLTVHERLSRLRPFQSGNVDPLAFHDLFESVGEALHRLEQRMLRLAREDTGTDTGAVLALCEEHAAWGEIVTEFEVLLSRAQKGIADARGILTFLASRRVRWQKSATRFSRIAEELDELDLLLGVSGMNGTPADIFSLREALGESYKRFQRSYKKSDENLLAVLRGRVP